MNKRITNFFHEFNTIQSVDSANYDNIEFVGNLAEGIVKTTGQGVYVIDYFKEDILYVSQNILGWCGITVSKIEKYGYDLFLDYLPEDDIKMLFEINNAGLKFMLEKSTSEILKYTISYDFHFNNFMVNQHYTPLMMKDGKIWLSLCVVSLSSKKNPGNIVLKNSDEKFWYEYSLIKKKWMKKIKPQLTHKEKSIVSYSIQGLSTLDIAGKMNVSYETIKKQKSNLFKKIGVNSMPEAIVYIFNNGLIM